MSTAMNDEIIPCVNGIIKAFRKGNERTLKICNAASRNPTSARSVLVVVEPAQVLQRTLADCENRVQYAYSRSVSVFGPQYTQGISADRELVNRLQGLTINLQEQLEFLASYFEDPLAFDLGSFPYIQKAAEGCRDQTVELLASLHIKLERARLQSYNLPSQEDQARPPSQYQHPHRPAPPDEVSPMTTAPPQFPIAPNAQNAANAVRSHGDDRTTLPSHHHHHPAPQHRPGPTAAAEWPTRDRAILYSQNQPATTGMQWPTAQASSMNIGNSQNHGGYVNAQGSGNTANPLSFAARVASAETAQSDRIKSPSHYDKNIRPETNTPMDMLAGNYKETLRLTASRPEAPPRSVSESDAALIDSEDVVRHARSIENFLEKRKQSRVLFQHEIDHLRQLSLNSASTSSSHPGVAHPSSPQPSEAYPSSPQPSIAHPSQRLTYTADTDTDLVASPITTSRPNSTVLMTRSQSREGPNPPPGGSGNRNSATLPQTLERGISSDFETFKYPDSPLSPPMSARQSANDVVLGLATTLKLPGFGAGVEEGIEVAIQGDSDPGKMLVNEIHDLPTPATSVRSIDYPITHDTSFYKYNGFCSGAKMIQQGNQKALKVIKMPGAHLYAFISKQCVECKYEMSFDVWDKDNNMDKSGIYCIGDIYFRQRFLTKCHLAGKETKDSFYACIFCIEESKTVDDYDATVFFSLTTLFRHFQKHTRPVKEVEGIKVGYGPDIEDLDIDIQFKTMDPTPSPFVNIPNEFKDRPTARAIDDHRKRSKKYKEKDPDGRPTLQFANGARIVGITYSESTKGEWCHGYHDGEKGYFPAALIALDPPKYDLTSSHNSRLTAVSRWEYKPPKESNPNFLRFGTKAKITNISYPCADAWCYSGRYKDKWGLFPACFVQDLKEDGDAHSPVESRKSSVDTRKPSRDDGQKGGRHFSVFKRRGTDKSG